jgi:hypothetical protein
MRVRRTADRGALCGFATSAHADQLPKYYIEDWCPEYRDGSIISIARMKNVETECEGERLRISSQGYYTGGKFCRFTEIKLTGAAWPPATKTPPIPEVAVTIKCPEYNPVKARMYVVKGAGVTIEPLYGVPPFPRR